MLSTFCLVRVKIESHDKLPYRVSVSYNLLISPTHVICRNFPLLRCLLSPTHRRHFPSTSTSSSFLSLFHFHLSLLNFTSSTSFSFSIALPYLSLVFLGDSSEYQESLFFNRSLFASLFCVLACLSLSRNRSLTTVLHGHCVLLLDPSRSPALSFKPPSRISLVL